MRRTFLSTALMVSAASAVVLPALPADAQTIGSSCGSTVFTSCSATEHYSDMNQWLGGNPDLASCPPYFGDWALASGIGNGIEHVNFNKDGDWWATGTWTGNVTITFYPASSVNIVTDGDGNVVSSQITGPAEQILTGHLTQWDGGGANKQSNHFTFTLSFEGTDQAGAPIKVHATDHANWTPGSDPYGPPSNSHDMMTCN